MVQVVGMHTAEDQTVGGNEADIMDDDVLSRLRHLRSTLNECRCSIERVDGFLLHRPILPAGETFFPTLPEDPFTPQTKPGDRPIHQLLLGDSLGTHAHTSGALEPHVNLEDALEPHVNPEDALDLPVILIEGGGWDTQSEHPYSTMADKATTQPEDTHSMDVYDKIHPGDARTRPHHAHMHPGQPLTSSTKQLNMSVQEDQQHKTKNEETNIEEQTHMPQNMRKDQMSEVKEAQEHVDRTLWTVMVGELAEDLDTFKDGVEDAITVGRGRRKLIKQPNIEDDEGIISHNDLEDNLGTRDIYGQQSEELRVLGDAEERAPREGDSRSLADLHLSQSAHQHCNTCVDLNLEKVKYFIISLQNSLGYSATTIRRHHRTTSGGSPRETETTTDLMAAARPAPPPTSGSSTGPLGTHSQPKEFSSQPLHPPPSHCSHEAHLSSCPTHPGTSGAVTLLGRSKWHLQDSLAIVVVILLLLLVLIFLACCVMLVVPVVTIRSLQGPAAF